MNFETVCLPLRSDLHAVAVRLCRDPERARDLVQEALLRALANWASYDVRLPVMPWLCRILRNHYFDELSAAKRFDTAVELRPLDMLAAFHATSEPITGELAEEVQRALARLSPAWRAVLQRVDLCGESYREVADAMHTPIGTVMSRLSRARRALAKELASYARAQGVVR